MMADYFPVGFRPALAHHLHWGISIASFVKWAFGAIPFATEIELTLSEGLLGARVPVRGKRKPSIAGRVRRPVCQQQLRESPGCFTQTFFNASVRF